MFIVAENSVIQILPLNNLYIVFTSWLLSVIFFLVEIDMAYDTMIDNLATKLYFKKEE